MHESGHNNSLDEQTAVRKFVNEAGLLFSSSYSFSSMYVNTRYFLPDDMFWHMCCH
jgi:hypothetical protein